MGTGLTLRLKERLPAAPGTVFAALTEPDRLDRWWGPHGFTTPEIALDLRPGGGYRFTMQPPEGEAFHLRGEFREVDPPRRLAYTFHWEEPDPDDVETTVVLTLRDAGGATELELEQGGFATEDRLALHRGGWTDSLERLRAVL